MNIIGRKTWGARPPARRLSGVASSKRREFIVHYSGGPADQSVRAIQDWCMDGRDFPDIDYNFLVRGTTGEIFQGVGWDKVGTHTKGHNTAGWGVCVITDGPISQQAKDAVRWLYQQARGRAGHDLLVRGHGDVTHATDCPGKPIGDWVRAGGVTSGTAHRQLRLASPRMKGQDVGQVQQIVGAARDNVYGPKTEAAVIAWQRAHHLEADGIVGPKTRAAMSLPS